MVINNFRVKYIAQRLAGIMFPTEVLVSFTADSINRYAINGLFSEDVQFISI